MDTRIVEFLRKDKVSVLTTLIKGGRPHSATVHYAMSEEPFYFVVWTGSKSRKLSVIRIGRSVQASMVIGFSEKKWLTMQMEGELKWLKTDNEIADAWSVYRWKYGGTKKFENGPDSALVRFTPNWWRFTKVKPYPSLIISSEP